ncbi:hypothetical protein R6Q59_025689 [Mikania micrantha]
MGLWRRREAYNRPTGDPIYILAASKKRELGVKETREIPRLGLQFSGWRSREDDSQAPGSGDAVGDERMPDVCNPRFLYSRCLRHEFAFPQND